MQATIDPEVNALLGDLLLAIRRILGERLVGLYLYGSLVWGDFDYDISDIDLLAATAVDVDDQVGDELKRMHDDLARKYPAWNGRIEVQYLALAGLRTFKTRRGRMAVISPGEPFHVIEAGRDWLLNWYFVQQKGVTLFGPPPATLIEPISKAEYIDAVRAQTREWRTYIRRAADSRPYQAYAILTLCRALYATRTGEQVSKRQAALWAEGELPQWAGLIEDALRWRAAYREQNVRPEATFPVAERFVHEVIDRIVGEG